MKNYKKMILFLALITALLLPGCSKSNDGTNTGGHIVPVMKWTSTKDPMYIPIEQQVINDKHYGIEIVRMVKVSDRTVWVYVKKEGFRSESIDFTQSMGPDGTPEVYEGSLKNLTEKFDGFKIDD